MLPVGPGYRIHGGESMAGLNGQAADMAQCSNFALVERRF